MTNEELERQVQHVGVGMAHIAYLVDMNMELIVAMIDSMGLSEDVEGKMVKLMEEYNNKAKELQAKFDEIREKIDNGEFDE